MHPPAVVIRPNVKLIAEEAGVSVATVSLALRNHSKISTATRNRVRATADRLGYRPDPNLARLMAQVRHGRRGGIREVLAMVRFEGAVPGTVAREHLDEIVEGSQFRAAQLGYGLEVLPLDERQMTGRRMIGVLQARGIEGVILLGSPLWKPHLPFPVANIVCVTIGYSLGGSLHRICEHHYQDMFTVLDHLKSRGYRRPGLVLNADLDRRVNHLYAAALLVRGQVDPSFERIPPLVACEITRMDFVRWVRRNSPDAIIFSQPPPTLMDLGVWLREAAAPEVGLVDLDLRRRSGGRPVCGICQARRACGAAAVENLVSQLHRGEKGLPARPIVHLIEGTWVEGMTLRPRILETGIVRGLTR